ncbi:pyridoxamine 5'-phosphate oxidase family protein [Natronomonas sp.]|uniref:pyridoxamine 5'-phosphate oxidase family protein n=1 Tax=Natronomonas sp. TaxID=2184060 RepID=UPI002604BC73|nr:pyridoxamine 5'-phosphate oxidase family protein [Natronomonas sp.]
MTMDRRAEMSAEATDEFLGANETGVLSLARADEPYAIPVSYGYDPSARQFYMRLVSAENSDKRAFVASGRDARLVVYDGDGDAYRSVVATGELSRIDPEELTAADIRQYGEAKRPLFEVWPEGKGDLDIELYRLNPDTVSGRSVSVSRE